jgi:asparagine synthase (glutamine-hydrolysing)
MCGIAGIVMTHAARVPDLRVRLERMQAALRHRGPDDEGILLSPEHGTRQNAESGKKKAETRGHAVCGLAHTRLAILDPSLAGHQPMSTPDGRYTVTFNGEIYNFRRLRRELEAKGEAFHSNSDTEVLLKLYRLKGAACVHDLEGMFVFALWDQRQQTCFLARDPFGIKPLYYYERDGFLAFASELRALLASGLVSRRLSAAGLNGYLLFGSVQEPDTLLEEVACLPAGHLLLWHDGKIDVRRYWDARFDPNEIAQAAAVADAKASLEDSVRRHFVSDVPVSVFLSGGIDSTALVALAWRCGVNELRTFSISFDQSDLNEGDLAARTARHFATEHHDWRLTSAVGKRLLPGFLKAMDQPSIDGFNTFCVAKHAHDHGAKVVLSGVGGDELFGGYPSFGMLPRLVKSARAMGAVRPISRAAGSLLERLGPAPSHGRLGSFLRGTPTMPAAYWAMRGTFTPAEVERLAAVYLGELPQTPEIYGSSGDVPAQPTPADEVSYLELTRYMRNQLLRDSDVMSMAWGLELRVPFVDRPLFEVLARIPAAVRLRAGKKLLLEAVREVPEWVWNRPKQGFVFPFAAWMMEERQDMFARLDLASPVGLQTWYRRWCLFALESFLDRNDIEAGRLGENKR